MVKKSMNTVIDYSVFSVFSKLLRTMAAEVINQT